MQLFGQQFQDYLANYKQRPDTGTVGAMGTTTPPLADILGNIDDYRAKGYTEQQLDAMMAGGPNAASGPGNAASSIASNFKPQLMKSNTFMNPNQMGAMPSNIISSLQNRSPAPQTNFGYNQAGSVPSSTGPWQRQQPINLFNALGGILGPAINPVKSRGTIPGLEQAISTHQPSGVPGVFTR